MPVQRSLSNRFFRKDASPAWHCPACSGGYFIIKPGTFCFAETLASRQAENFPDWSPEYTKYRFSGLLQCNNASCREIASIAGWGYHNIEPYSTFDQDPEETEYHVDEYDIFYPTYIIPSPALIRMPHNAPESVKTELKKAFTSFWGDAHAAMNHIRSAIENLLDHLKVERMQTNKQGEEVRRTLHERILSLQDQNKPLSDFLQAIKWLGNAGSHADDISQDDVYNAIDIVEMVLDDLFVRHREDLLCVLMRLMSREALRENNEPNHFYRNVCVLWNQPPASKQHEI